MRAQDKTFKLIIIRHGYLQLLVSTQSNFLSSPYQIYSRWACHSWFVFLWQFMDKAQVKIHMADAWLHPPLSGNDINIMDHFMQQNNPIQKLLQINRCRVYLQVLSLSDLASADGARLIAPALSGSHLIDRWSTLEWPNQECPTKADWRVWEAALKTFCVGTTLIHPLTMAGPARHQPWFWFMDDQRILYSHTSGNWLGYQPASSSWNTLRSNTTLYCQSTSRRVTIPEGTLVPASVELSQGYIQAVKALPTPDLIIS